MRSRPCDAYSHIPRHGSATRPPKGRENPGKGMSGEFKQLDISSNHGAPSQVYFTDDSDTKDLDLWREAIRHTDSEKLSTDLLTVWSQCTELYYNFFENKKFMDTDSIKNCFSQMIVESLANKSSLVQQELMRNSHLDLRDALELISNEVLSDNFTRPTKNKSEYKERNTNNHKGSWKKSNNSGKKNHKFRNP